MEETFAYKGERREEKKRGRKKKSLRILGLIPYAKILQSNLKLCYN